MRSEVWKRGALSPGTSTVMERRGTKRARRKIERMRENLILQGFQSREKTKADSFYE
jgi:hypothetical protein